MMFRLLLTELDGYAEEVAEAFISLSPRRARNTRLIMWGL